MPTNSDLSPGLARLIAASALAVVTAASGAGIAAIMAVVSFPEMHLVGSLLGGIFPVAGWVLGRDVAGLTHLRGRGHLIVLGLVAALASGTVALGIWVGCEVDDLMFASLIASIAGGFAAAFRTPEEWRRQARGVTCELAGSLVPALGLR